MGRSQEAKAMFETALTRFGGFETHVEYAIWAIQNGDTGTASRLQTDLDKMMKRWSKHTRLLNTPHLQRLAAVKNRQ
jgi:hypothetical protein